MRKSSGNTTKTFKKPIHSELLLEYLQLLPEDALILLSGFVKPEKFIALSNMGSETIKHGVWRYAFQRDLSIEYKNFISEIFNLSAENLEKRYKELLKQRYKGLNDHGIKLFLAISRNSLSKIKKMQLNTESLLAAQDSDEYDVIHWASRLNRSAILAYFYEKACKDIFSEKENTDQYGYTKLHWAALCGQVDAVAKELIRSSDDKFVDQVIIASESPLWLAARNGHIAVVKTLLDAGADVDQPKSDYGTTPLAIAAEKEQLAMLQCLLNAGATIDQPDYKGVTPLGAAAGKGCLKAVIHLLNAGATLNPQSDSTDIPPLLEAAKNGQLQVIQYLHERGAALDQADSDGTSSLLVAVYQQHLLVAEYLLQNGAQVNQSNYDDTSPLLIAVYNRDLPMVRLLLKFGASINQENNEGATLLSMAHPDEYNSVEYSSDEYSDNDEYSSGEYSDNEYGHPEIYEYLMLYNLALPLKDRIAAFLGIKCEDIQALEMMANSNSLFSKLLTKEEILLKSMMIAKNLEDIKSAVEVYHQKTLIEDNEQFPQEKYDDILSLLAEKDAEFGANFLGAHSLNLQNYHPN